MKRSRENSRPINGAVPRSGTGVKLKVIFINDMDSCTKGTASKIFFGIELIAD